MKNKVNTKIGNATGRLAEEISCRFLISKDFKVIDRNYRKKWGEIDIICKKDGVFHFVEVKSVSCEKIDQNVTHENFSRETYIRPEENVSFHKLKKLSRVIKSYLIENRVSSETDWSFDVISMLISRSDNRVYVKMLENMGIS